jgi:hypothetical protein
MSLIAKPVVDKQFWILQENNKKVGNLEACDGGYQIRINNQVVAQYKSIRMIAEKAKIQFENAPKLKSKKHVTANQVHGYQTVGRAHNAMWDLVHKLPVYTKTSKSKSWFAAGWYRVKKGRTWSVMQDPKLIVLQRYRYNGPYQTQTQAKEPTELMIKS